MTVSHRMTPRINSATPSPNIVRSPPSAGRASVPHRVARRAARRDVLREDVRGDAADVCGKADRDLDRVVRDIDVHQALLIATAVTSVARRGRGCTGDGR